MTCRRETSDILWIQQVSISIGKRYWGTARRRGRAWRAGDKVITGGTNAAKARFDDERPMHEAWLARDAELQAEVSSQHQRARIIAEEWHREPNTVRGFLRRNSKKI
jgi:hypothetical protein